MDKAQLENLYFRSLQFKPSKADARKIAILDATLKCIATEGIDKVSLQEIGHRVKMRRSHVVYYYKTVPEMVADALNLVLATGQEITVAFLSNIKDPAKLLEAYVEATFMWFHLHPEHPSALFLMCHFGALSEVYSRALTQMRQNSETRIQQMLHLYLKTKRRKVRDDQVAHAAHCIRGVIMGNLLDYFTTEKRISYTQLRQITCDAAHSIAENI